MSDAWVRASSTTSDPPPAACQLPLVSSVRRTKLDPFRPDSRISGTVLESLGQTGESFGVCAWRPLQRK